MFIAGNLVFLELQKTGGSHIRRLMATYLHGNAVGKHNRITQDYVGHYLIGSIRNPWDWYVSLWAYGVGGSGAIRHRTCKGIDFPYYHKMLPKSMGKDWLGPKEFLVSIYHDLTKSVNAWGSTYQDSSDPKLFQAWLKMILDPKHRFDLGEGYGFSPLSQHAGLMTYRYFRLFTIGDRVYKDKSLSEFDSLALFDVNYGIVKDMIRMESLEEDFLRIVDRVGMHLSEEQINEINDKKSGKTNTSKRMPVEYYYDETTAQMVAEKERYLIGKFGYKPPVLA